MRVISNVSIAFAVVLAVIMAIFLAIDGHSKTLPAVAKPLSALVLATPASVVQPVLKMPEGVVDGSGCTQAILKMVNVVNDGSARCKAVPSASEQTLVAYAEFQSDDQQGDDTQQDGTYNLRLYLVESASGRLLAQGEQDGVYGDGDAARFWGIELDTARYYLKKDLRAFGVRASFGGVKNIDLQQLDLYVRQGDKIVPVLNSLEVLESGNNQMKCPDSNAGDGDGAIQITRTLSMGASGPMGYADILVKDSVTTTSAEIQKGLCISTKPPPEIRRYVLHYEGTRYAVPKELNSEGG